MLRISVTQRVGQRLAQHLQDVFLGAHIQGVYRLEIELKAGKVGFAKGNYVIDVEADGKKGKCETKLPLPACLKDGAVKAGLNFRCSGDLGLNMEQAPCAEPKVGPSIGSLKIDGSPKDVKITVTNNKKPYGEVSVAPKYKESRPNGPECEPLCKQGNTEACVTGKCGE